MNCLIYARVSTERQADKELSIPAQLQACRQYAHQRNWTIIDETIEPGISARTADRPGLRALLDKCRDADPKIGVVLVHKVDRLARNLADHVTVRGLLKADGVTLASVVENLDDSNSGVLVEHIMASLAEFYSANLSEEVKKGMQQRVRQGGWPHNPPRGYNMAQTPSDRRIPVPDPELAPKIRMAFQMAATGFETLTAFRHALARIGLTAVDGDPLAASALMHLLRNPFYAGNLLWKSNTYAGNHEPIVSQELFDRVQVVLRIRRIRQARQKREFLLRGLATCEMCESLMTGGIHGGREYYRCCRNSAARDRCRARFCRAADAHARIKEVLRSIPLAHSVRQYLQSRIKSTTLAQVELHRVYRTSVRGRINDLNRRSVELADVFAAGAIDSDVYRLTAERLRQEREAMKTQLSNDAPRPASLTGRTLWDFHSQLTFAEQRALLALVIGTVALGPTGITLLALKSPFDRLAERSEPA